MVFIFVHSAMPGDLSGAESKIFAEILASITGMSYKAASFIVRKIAHFTEYSVLGIFLSINAYDFIGSSGKDTADSLRSIRLKISPQIIAWLAGTAYAAIDEFHQLFVEGRSCEFRDMCIDSAGVALGLLIGSLAHHHIRRSNDTEGKCIS